jgi:hypothetical protein
MMVGADPRAQARKDVAGISENALGSIGGDGFFYGGSVAGQGTGASPRAVWDPVEDARSEPRRPGAWAGRIVAAARWAEAGRAVDWLPAPQPFPDA